MYNQKLQGKIKTPGPGTYGKDGVPDRLVEESKDKFHGKIPSFEWGKNLNRSLPLVVSQIHTAVPLHSRTYFVKFETSIYFQIFEDYYKIYSRGRSDAYLHCISVRARKRFVKVIASVNLIYEQRVIVFELFM